MRKANTFPGYIIKILVFISKLIAFQLRVLELPFCAMAYMVYTPLLEIKNFVFRKFPEDTVFVNINDEDK